MTVFFSFFLLSDENSKNVCAQYLITSETNTAALGELNHILNLDNETICIKFETEPGASLDYNRFTSTSLFNAIL